MRHDPLSLIDVDHLELYVGNAKQAAFYYAVAWGFNITGYRGLETGCRDHASYLLEQGNIRLVLTSALTKAHPANGWVQRFGDGVANIAFTTDNAMAAFEETVLRGADPVGAPETFEDSYGKVHCSAIHTFGEVVHTFVDRSRYGGHFMPGFEPVDPSANRYNRDGDCGLRFVDHLVGNVGVGEMDHWVGWYEKVMGFSLYKHFDDRDISTEYSALMSKVMSSGRGMIKIPINEPAEGLNRSQVQEYLDWHGGVPGVQHVAFRTDDEIDSVGRLNARGVEFLRLPSTYYELTWDRVGEIVEDRQKIEELGILVDRDDQGYLLQIFTRPVEDRPTLFFEIITRRGSESFGKGNFRALFESLELEQARRGNL